MDSYYLVFYLNIVCVRVDFDYSGIVDSLAGINFKVNAVIVKRKGADVCRVPICFIVPCPTSSHILVVKIIIVANYIAVNFGYSKFEQTISPVFEGFGDIAICEPT